MYETHPHIVVVDPAARSPETGAYNYMVVNSGLCLTYHLPCFFGTRTLFEDNDHILGIVILGSAASVHDNLVWQRELIAWLQPKLAAGIPTLGICYGHQLLAHMHGGKVDFVFEDQHKHLGLRKVELKACPIWPKSTGELVVSHREHVVECPDSMEIIGSSPEIPIEALAHKTLPIWSTQPHPEASSSFLQGAGIPAEDAPLEKRRFGHSLVLNFLVHVANK